MYSLPVIHESRNLKQARPFGQYVDLLRRSACYSLTSDNHHIIICHICQDIDNIFYKKRAVSAENFNINATVHFQELYFIGEFTKYINFSIISG